MMPIEIKDCDEGRGNIIESRGTITDHDLVNSLLNHLTSDKEKFKKYKYILIDHTALTQVNISDETVDLIAGICADVSQANPDPIVAMVTNVTIGANVDLIKRISRLYALFIYQSSWKTMVFRNRIEAVRWIKREVRDKFGIYDLTFG